ncbi:MAG: DNA-directed RNA polymerase subunit beta [Victivallaceae bacterium]|nr:DNA-directed RNA polymerase subunit beta [Victivallaceae bacterium]
MGARKNLGKLENVLDLPNLIGVQIDSFDQFLQPNVAPEKRRKQGLQELFMETFPVKSLWSDNHAQIDFLSYRLGEPRFTQIECLKDGVRYEGTWQDVVHNYVANDKKHTHGMQSNIYGAPLYVKLKLSVAGRGEFVDEVFLGIMPLMTERGTFIINGAERVIVSQLHRSPGVCFERVRHLSGKYLYSFRIAPERGSWLEVQFEPSKDILYVYLDKDRTRRRRKFLFTTYLRTLPGCETNREILEKFYTIRKFKVADLLKKDDLSGLYTFDDIVDESGNIIVKEFQEISETSVKELSDNDIKQVELCDVGDTDACIFATLRCDDTRDKEDAIKVISDKLRPNEPVNPKTIETTLYNFFFAERHYDLGLVGRHKLNMRLGLDIPEDMRQLTPEDILASTRELFHMRQINAPTDDIDHLGARRVRSIGELLKNECRRGIQRIEAYIHDRLNGEAVQTATTPAKFINAKMFFSVVHQFFARSQLSQIMDQTNPLSELTNKRRLSALGPGGLSRDRAGFEVRDVHASHYGRICPIETPEGPNIGLINYMSLYAFVDEFGFLETPYRKVVNGKATKEVEYLTADQEEKFVIAQANALLNEKHEFVRPMVMCRLAGEPAEYPREMVQYMDVSPQQLVSAAAGIIPFLEHDDANRALMGANMQRQAVPLMMPEAPYVGTGLESRIARDCGAVVVAREDGIVADVSSDHIVITPDGEYSDDPKYRYELFKYLRSNEKCCINQRPVVHPGDKVKKGQYIADGASTQDGELALGRNVLVAFMPWCGYNFEDAIVVNQQLINSDAYTSIHIEKYNVQCEDSRRGSDEITRDIPNMSSDALAKLDERGIVYEGALVKAGDVLVGKITPKTEEGLSPEEILLLTALGEKSRDVKDSSLRLPNGVSGIVMETYVKLEAQYARTASKTEKKQQRKQAMSEHREKGNSLRADLVTDLKTLLVGTKIPASVSIKGIDDVEPVMVIHPNRKITQTAVKTIAEHFNDLVMDECVETRAIRDVIAKYKPEFEENDKRLARQLATYDAADEGVESATIKQVDVYVAKKRKLQVGDKMAGRHGNKGIVSRIVATEDMPFLSDGTSVDIVLNPLGVPSRMNLGQVLETNLGWAAKMLGIKVATPVFDGVTEDEIVKLMTKANEKFAEENGGHNYHWGFRQEPDGSYVYDGKTVVYDGRTGEPFDQRVMVGQIYMLKLNHLVADKIHARSNGSYSLTTQQPLGGRQQKGGQRLGEMEVWALEAYGAANCLREMVTVKSDDRLGRINIYRSIVRGEGVLESGQPESFNVLLSEMRGLCIDVRPLRRSSEKANK